MPDRVTDRAGSRTLTSLSALGDAPAELRFDGCTLRELARVPKLRLQAHRGDLERLAERAGDRLPFVPNTTLGSDPWLLWRAPGEWLAYALDSAADGGSSALDELVERRLAGLGLLSAEVSSGLSLFELRGPAAVELLLRDCTLDLEGDAVPIGGCAQTPIAQLSLLLHRPAAGASGESCWHLFVDRTAARHFWRWLVDTAELLRGAGGRP